MEGPQTINASKSKALINGGIENTGHGQCREKHVDQKGSSWLMRDQPRQATVWPWHGIFKDAERSCLDLRLTSCP